MSASTASPAAQAALSEQIAALGPWFHNLHLPDGVQTAPDHFLGDFPRKKWRQFAHAIPEDLTGWTALDIGCNAGFYSFELARRGARVTAIDVDERYLRQAEWAAQRLGLADDVRFEQLAVYDLARLDRKWDLVWFMGVLYHLRYPLLALDILARRVERMMVFQTLTMPDDEVVETPANFSLTERELMASPGWPKLAFIERSLAKDPTNWWAANHACVEAMLRSSGFRVIDRPAHEVYVCEPAPREPLGIDDQMESEYRSATGQS